MNSYIPTRKAILIGSPGTEPYLHGVEKDLSGMGGHLCSFRGGDWRPREIKTLQTPSADQLLEEINNSVVDYLYIYYSGHGCLDEKGNTQLAINEKETVSDISLFNGSVRQLIVTDTCRKIVSATIGGIGDADWGYFNFTDDYSIARQYFDWYINNAAPSRLIVHSTQPGRKAYDSVNEIGGDFTLSLLKQIKEIKTSHLFSPIYIQDVIQQITPLLLSKGNLQIPDIIPIEGNFSIPFALDAPVPVPLEQTIQPVYSSTNIKNNNDWLVLGGVALFLYAAFNSKL